MLCFVPISIVFTIKTALAILPLFKNGAHSTYALIQYFEVQRRVPANRY